MNVINLSRFDDYEYLTPELRDMRDKIMENPTIKNLRDIVQGKGQTDEPVARIEQKPVNITIEKPKEEPVRKRVRDIKKKETPKNVPKDSTQKGKMNKVIAGLQEVVNRVIDSSNQFFNNDLHESDIFRVDNSSKESCFVFSQ